MFPKWNDWNVTYTRKGLLKHRLQQALKIVAFAAVLVGLFRLRQAGRSVTDIPRILQQYVRLGLSTVLSMINHGIEMIQSRV